MTTAETQTRRSRKWLVDPRSRSVLQLATAGLAAALLAVPGIATGALADSKATPPTVESIVAADGSVVSSQTVTSGANGASTAAFSGTSPIKTAITYTLDGKAASRDQLKGAHGAMTATFRVQNDTGKAQDVTYVGPDGAPHTVSTVIQVPYVATVEATIPRAYRNLQADGASISTAGDGMLHLAWSMVLFSPIGSPSQEVSFSADLDAPSGMPGVVVRARPVNPGASAELSANSRAANATQTQDDILHALSGGADDGLTKLRAGASLLIDGLAKLHDGSSQLSGGLGAASSGSKQLADGLHTADAGGHQLANAFTSPTGAADLTGGSTALAAGLTQIDAGLAKLDDPTLGLVKAQKGSVALGAGVDQVLAGLGTYNSTPAQTILYGLNASRSGLTTLEAGITSQALPGLALEKSGDLCLALVLSNIANGATAAPPYPLPGSSRCWPTGRPALAALAFLPNFILNARVIPKIGNANDMTPDTLVGGLNLLSFGLSNPACDPANPTAPLNPCGGVQVLDLINTDNFGVNPPVISGLGQVTLGLSNPTCVPGSLVNRCGVKEGLGTIRGGLTSLTDGLLSAVTGVHQLHIGSTAAAAGGAKLKDGIGQAGAGATKLAGGLDQLSAGADKLSGGVPAAVAGSGKITDGLASAQGGAGQLQGGLADLQTQAVGPLGAQLADGSSNARLELATIEATGARAATAPMGADATWLYRLDAAIPVEDTQGGKNVALGGGALLLLVVGIGAGFLLGRRRLAP